jgi:hypothetical protein
LEIFTNSADEGITIKSTGNTSNAVIFDAVRNANSAISAVRGQWDGTAVADMLFYAGADYTNKDDGYIVFRTSSADNIAEHMRIDSSGNLLVGKSVTTQNTAGTQISASSGVRATVDGNVATILNRTTSDGDIALFRKDGTTVGSIGAFNGDTVIGTGVAGLRMNDGSPAITPHRMDTNNVADNSVDLGNGSARFKDLYLSGTGYVGTSLGIGAGDINLSGVGTASQNVVTTIQGNAQFRGILELANSTGVSSAGASAGDIAWFDNDNKIAQISGLGQDTTNHDDGELAFSTTSGGTLSEAMRIDSSGNLLVGMTSANTNNDGVGLRADGLIHGKRAGVVATLIEV